MKISKEMLQRAMEEVIDEDLLRIKEKCKEENIKQQIEESMKKNDWRILYQKTQEPEKHQIIWWSKVAIIFLVILVASSATVYAIEKVRQAGVKWEVKQGKNEDDFYFEADNPEETVPSENIQVESPVQIERRYEPSYVPEGFKESSKNQQDKLYHVVYEKDGGILHFYQLIKTAETMEDLKLTKKKSITINGYAGEMGHQGNKKILNFATELYVFRLVTKEIMKWDEMIQMAESISKMSPDCIEVYYEPTYLPKGYEEWKEEGSKVDEIMTDIIYVKKKKDAIVASISFSQVVLNTSISIDSENMSRKIVDINGWKGQLNYKKNKKSLIWATNEYAFSVHGNGKVATRELLKVARSLKPNKKIKKFCPKIH